MKLLYLYSLSVFSPLCVAIKMDLGFNLNEDNVLEETHFSKVEGSIHRALQSTFLNSCDTLTDNSQCCVGHSNECYKAGDKGTFEVDTGSCRSIGITSPSCIYAAQNGGSIKIGKESCNEKFACNQAAKNDGNVIIKDSSCNGDEACQQIGESYGAPSNWARGKVVVGKKSCNGSNACAYAGRFKGNLTIADDACNEGWACKDVGTRGIAIISSYSCEGPAACGGGGRFGTFYIDEGSCQKGTSTSAYMVCYDICAGDSDLPYDPSRTTVRIGKNSCYGDRGCLYVGSYGGDVVIGDESCQSDKGACNSLGLRGTGKVIVHNNSCIGSHSCLNVGSKSTGTVTIYNGSCIGSNACAGTGQANTLTRTDVKIAENSCKGRNACDALGAQGGVAIIGEGSCTGTGSDYQAMCTYAGSYGSYFEVGQGSCKNGYAVCYAWQGSTRPGYRIIIGDSSCFGNTACSFVNYPSRATIGKNSCLCEYCCSCLSNGDIVPDNKCHSLGSGIDNCCISKHEKNSNFDQSGPISFPNSTAATLSPTSLPTYIPSSLPSTSPTSTSTSLPTFIPSSLPSTSPTSTSSSPPSTLIDTIKKYTIILEKSSFDSSQFMLTTEHTTSDLSAESQIKMSIMTFDCNATYGGIGLGGNVTDAEPVVLIETTSLVGTLLSNTFYVEKFALENSVLTSTVSNSDKSIAGKLKFCVKAEIIIGARSVNFRESNIILDYDLSSNSFSITGNEIKKENIILSEESVSNIYSIEACRCKASSHECLSQSETSQTLNQDSFVSICLQPNSTDVKISELNMKFFHHELSGVFFETVTNSTGIPGLSIISGSGSVSNPFKITSRLFSSLFDNRARTFDIKGTAYLQFHSSTRNLNLRSNDRVLQQEEFDGESASYQMSVDIRRREMVESEYDLAAFSTPVVAGFLVLVLSIAAVIYKKLS